MRSTSITCAGATFPDLAGVLALLQEQSDTSERAIRQATGRPWAEGAALIADAMLAFLRDRLGCELGWVRLGAPGGPPRLLQYALGPTLAARDTATLAPLLSALLAATEADHRATTDTAPYWLCNSATGAVEPVAPLTGAADPALAALARDLGLCALLGVPLGALAADGGTLGTLVVGTRAAGLPCPAYAQLHGLLGRHLGRALGAIEHAAHQRPNGEDMRAVTEEATDGIYIVDDRGVFTYVNPQTERYLGYSAGELLGRHFSDFVVPESIPLAQRSLDRAAARLADEATKDLELRRKDGVVRTFEINGRNRYDPHDGRFLGRFGIARDITERRQLETELARRTRALEALNAIATLAGRSSDLTGLLAEALDRTLAVFKLPQGALFLLQPGGRELRLAASRGYGDTLDAALAHLRADTPLAEMLLTSEQPLLGGDLAREVPLLSSFADRAKIRQYGCVPLRSQEQTLGLLLVSGGEERALAPADRATLAILGAQLGAAIENARLAAEAAASRARLEERTAQLSRLLMVSAGFTANRPLDAMLDSVASAFVETLGFSNAHVRVRNDDGTALIGVGFCGYAPPESAALRAATPLAFYERLLDERFHLGGLYYIPHDSDRRAVFDDDWSVIRHAPRPDWRAGQWHPEDALVIPLRGRDESLLGVIYADEPTDGRVPDLEKAAVLELFGRQAALAIENAELYTQVARDLRRQKALREVIEHISAELDLDRLLEQLLADAVDLLGGDAGAFGLFDRASDTARIGTLNAMPRDVLDTVLGLGRGTLTPPLPPGQPLIVATPLAADTVVHTSLGVPVFQGGEIVGTFFVGSTDPARRFGQREVESLELFAKHAALALGNARLYEEARAQAARLETLRVAIERISSELDLPTLLNELAISTVRFLDADVGTIALIEEDSGRLRIEAGYNLQPGLLGLRLEEFAWPDDPLTGRPGPLRSNPGDHPPAPLPPELAHGHAHLAVPIWWQERLIGSFSLSATRPEKRFTAADAETLALLARHAAVAIENAGLYSALQERYSQVAGLSAVGAALIEARNLDDILQTVAQQIVSLIGADGCSIFLLPFDETTWGSGQELSLAASVGVGSASFAGRRLPLHGSVTGQAILDRAPATLSELLAGPPELTPALRAVGIDSLLTVPLQTSTRLIGAINAYGLPGKRFGPRDIEIMTLFAHQAAVAIENARLHEQGRVLAVAEERNRLAREIHDTLAQGFTGIILQLQVAESLLDGADPAVRERLTRAQELARASLREARRSVLNLRPSPLQGRSLPEALRAHLATWRGHTGIAADFRREGADRPLAPETEEALLRVAQEALNNTHKHARASRVDVTLTLEPTGVRLVVCDDGTGIGPGPRAGEGGFGLVSMRERIARLAGHFAIESTPGQGTCVRASIADHGPPPRRAPRRAPGSVPG